MTIRKKVTILLELGKPKLMLLFGIMAIVGALFSPNFYSESFPKTFFSINLALIFGGGFIFQPSIISLLHIFGAFLISTMIWFGTALFNDYYDIEIDKKINPHRPLIKAEITPGEVRFYALSAYILAGFLVFLEGDAVSKILAILFILIGLEYSAPPLRLRRWGLAATSVIGAGVFGAFLGGSASQYALSYEVIIMAIVLGALAAAASSVKDYKDIEGDTEAGVKTWPIIYGYDQSIKMNMILLGLCYAFSLLPYVLGYLALSSLPLILLIAFVNLKLINNLKIKRDLSSKRKIYVYCLMCYFAVVFIFAIAKILQ
jgi:4-hydroxybenzoate polyprenyltransferase